MTSIKEQQDAYMMSAAVRLITDAKKRIEEIPEHGCFKEKYYVQNCDYGTLFEPRYMFFFRFSCLHEERKSVDSKNDDSRMVEICVNDGEYVSGSVLCIGTNKDIKDKLNEEGLANYVKGKLWKHYHNLLRL